MHNPPEAVATLVTGEGLRGNDNINVKDEVKKIHKDNLHKLSTMAKEDILLEQSRLIASIGNYCYTTFYHTGDINTFTIYITEIVDPKLVELLQNRSKKSSNADSIRPVVESMDVEQKPNDITASSDMDVDVEKGNKE